VAITALFHRESSSQAADPLMQLPHSFLPPSFSLQRYKNNRKSKQL
jgi:hypothetical protein